MLFDFSSYLSRIDPSQSYNIEPLTGGVVNVTVRAAKLLSAKADGGRFPEHQTMIMKYAPPFTAGLGESAPFSQFRQVIESRALSLFTPPDGPLKDVGQATAVTIPHLIHFDQDSHVLILSDLGPLITLSAFLSPLPEAQSIEYSQLDVPSCYELGSRLGQTFAEIHSLHSLNLVGPSIRTHLSSSATRDEIVNLVVDPLKDKLDGLGISDAAELFKRIRADFLRNPCAEEQRLVVGDLWTGGVLVGKKTGTTIAEAALGIVDWEFAGLGEAVSGDMAQLTAHMHMYYLAAPAGSPLRGAIKSVFDGMATSYRRSCRADGAAWMLSGSEDESGQNIVSLTASSPAVSISRSAFITYGREMITYADMRDWDCECCEDGQKERCLLVRRMLDVGLWYLRTAGKNEAEFFENWEKVKYEKREMDLF